MNARAVAAETPGGPRLLLLAERLGPFRVCFPEAPLVRGCLVLVDIPDTRRALEALGVPITQHDAMSGFDWAGAPGHGAPAGHRDRVCWRTRRVPILNDIGRARPCAPCWLSSTCGAAAWRSVCSSSRRTARCTPLGATRCSSGCRGVGMRADVLSGPGPKRLKKLAESSAHVHIVNHDGFSRVAGLAEAMVGGYDILCVDEGDRLQERAEREA